MKIKILILFIFLIFFTIGSYAQKDNDSILVKIPTSALRQKKADTAVKIFMISPDVIVKTNGNMIQCKIVEVNDSIILYKSDPKDTARKYLAFRRDEVYAIAYGNGLPMVITPELMGKKADIFPKAGCEGWDKFKQNLGAGSINVGVGFINFYSPIKHANSFTDEQTMPSVFAGYTFRITGKLKAGAHLGFGGNKLSKSGVSEYDQLAVSNEIEEHFFNLGLFCRYDIIDGFIKPYIKGGFDFIGVNMTTTSTVESLDGKMASLNTVVHQRSIKPGLILRAGLDLYFGKKFGIYGDVGTGLSLVQVGVLFNLE
jgi:hypothetical protein